MVPRKATLPHHGPLFFIVQILTLFTAPKVQSERSSGHAWNTTPTVRLDFQKQIILLSPSFFLLSPSPSLHPSLPLRTSPPFSSVCILPSTVPPFFLVYSSTFYLLALVSFSYHSIPVFSPFIPTSFPASSFSLIN